jgi:hypothetical protein
MLPKSSAAVAILQQRDVPFYLGEFVERHEGRYHDIQLAPVLTLMGCPCVGYHLTYIGLARWLRSITFTRHSGAAPAA